MNLHRLIVTLFASALHAQSPADSISGNLFPPDFIVANAEAIHFTESQQQALRSTVAESQQRFAELQRDLKLEADALGRLLAQSAPVEAAVLAQFDKTQDQEREIKRAQLVLMLNLRAGLADDQRAKLKELRAKQLVQQRTPEYAAKMERIKAGVMKWQSAGRDTSPVEQVMQQLQPLMLAGKMDQAYALLDAAIKVLEQDGK